MTSGDGHGPPVEHLTGDDFRAQGRALLDWIDDYHRRVERMPVLSRSRPHEVYDALPAAAPEAPEPFDAVMDDLERIVMPGITHWQSPRFFGFFPANVSGPAILGELLAAGLGVQGMLWTTSPACTELEMRVLDWLVDLLGLPDAFRSGSTGGGVIQDTASSATLAALLAARERATDGRVNEHGVEGPLCVYGSTQAHSSLDKAVGIVGIGRRHLRRIETDAQHAMRPELLAGAIEDDRAAGRTPVMVCATVGTTSSGAVDPVPAIAEICRQHGVWLHVDAAWAGTAALCREHRHLHDGVEHADSYCFNPHKWMLTNFDCDCFWVADRCALINAMSIEPEYLRVRADDGSEVFDYRNWHIQLGRRFRALKLWMVIRHYGAEGLRAHVRHHVALADWLVERIEESSALELAAPPSLGLVCFRHRDGDDATRALLAALNASGRLFVTHTVLAGRYVVRFCIGQTHTERRHVEDAWATIDAVLSSGVGSGA